MKHTLYLYILSISIGISLFIASCSSSDSSSSKNPDEAKEMVTELDAGTTIVEDIDLEPVYFRYPYRIEIRDSLAVILDLHNDCHYLYAGKYRYHVLSSDGQIRQSTGSVPTGTTKQQPVTVRNSGSTVFKLKGFTTSCDCTEATCDWDELQPGKSGTFAVSYQAEKPSDFYRTVEIYGNIPDNALQFSFIGTVKETE